MATKPDPRQVAEPKKTEKNDPDVQPPESVKNALHPVDTGETRSFQTGPDTRENLTKEQARAKGFHWLDAPEDKKKA